MNTLSNELRGVIANRLQSASPQQVLAIAMALCSQEIEAAPLEFGAATPNVIARFQVQGETVLDTRTGLIWTRGNVGSGRVEWNKAKEAAAAVRIDGQTDWRLPTVTELLTLVEYERHDPAIDPAFKCNTSWYWTATPLASSPADYAWFVDFSYGLSSWSGQYDQGFVRAVRAGQLLGNLG